MRKALLFLSVCSQAWSLSCSTPVTLSQSGQDSYRPKVAINEKGEAGALWIAEKEDLDEETLLGATMDIEKKWSSALISESATKISQHKLFIDTEGNSFAVWRFEKVSDEAGELSFFQFEKKEKNKAWSPARNILDLEDPFPFGSIFDSRGNVLFFDRAKVKDPTSNSKRFRKVLVNYLHSSAQKKQIKITEDDGLINSEYLFRNKQGKTFAFWKEYTSKYDEEGNFSQKNVIKGLWSQEDNSWSDPVVAYDFENARVHLVDVKGAMNSKEDLVILWEKNDSNDLNTLQVITYCDQQWSKPYDLAFSKIYFHDFKVVMNDLGDIVAAWTATEKGKNVAYVAQKSKGGSWSTPLALSDVSRKAEELKIALDNEGNILAIWCVKEGKKGVLQTAYQPKGQPWSSPVSLSNRNNDCDEAKVCANGTGNFFVIWEEEVKKRSSIHGTTLSAKTQQWSYALLSPEGLDCSSFSFALNDKGEGIVAWQMTSDEEETSIQAAEFKID